MRTAFEREGDIRSVDLPAAFASLWREAATGVLRFSRPGRDVRFDFAQGEVVAVSSSDPAFDTAEVLIRAGKLDAVALDDRHVPEGGDRARSARDLGLLTERDWRWGEKIRAIEILADLVSWLDGEYAFSGAETPKEGEFRIGIHRLLLELFLRSGDREFVHHSLGATDSRLQRAADFDERFATLGLTADADPVVAAIDGRSTAAAISRRVPPDPFSVERLLAAMVTLGLVHPEYAADGTPVRPRKPARPKSTPAPPPKREPARPRKQAPSPPSPETVQPPPPAAAPPPPPARPPTPADEHPPREAGDAARGEDLLADIGERLELPLGPVPEPSEPEPETVLTGWEQGPREPLDQPLTLAESLDQPLALGVPPDEPLALPEPPRLLRPTRSSFSSVWILVLLALAVGGLLLWRARDHDATGIPVPGVTPPAAAGVHPTAAAPGFAAGAPAESPRAMLPTVSEAAIVPPPATQTPSPAPATLTPSPLAASPSPPATARATRPAASRRTLEDWVRLAERDRRRLEADPRTQYTIQLELVCELPSLEEAWDLDRQGSMWLLTAPFGDRSCFRVFWGRYATLDEARRARDSAPRFFFTPTNQPVVVSARRALLP